MKNLFLALMLTGFVGGASVNTVSAFVPARVIVRGGEESKKDKKCKKGDACCKSKTTVGNEKKCCSSATSQSKATSAQPSGTSGAKIDSKATETVK